MGQAAAELCLPTRTGCKAGARRRSSTTPRAAALAKAGGWDSGEGIVLSNLGMAYAWLGHTEQAADCWQRRLDLATRSGNTAGVAASLTNLGLLYWLSGEFDQAAEHHFRAAELHRDIGNRQNEAIALANLAETYHGLGRLDDAHDFVLRGLALYREVGDRVAEAESVRILAVVWLDLGNHVRALEVATGGGVGAVERLAWWTVRSGQRGWHRSGAAGITRSRTIGHRARRGEEAAVRRRGAATRFQAAIEAGVEPAALVDAINTAQEERAAAQAGPDHAPEVHTITDAAIHAMIDSLGDVGRGAAQWEAGEP